MNIFWFDLETTDSKTHRGGGIHQLSYIIEVDGVNVVERDFKVSPLKNDLVNAQSLTVCNVTYEQIMAYPQPQEAFKLLFEDCKKYGKMIMAGYNVAVFDIPFLMSWWYKARQNHTQNMLDYFYFDPLDVRVLALNKLMGVRSKMQDFKLHSVAQAVGVEVDEKQLHDALYDVKLTQQIYKNL